MSVRTVGILGGGQLARMLALSGYPLGLEAVILEPAPDACAAPVARHIKARYDDIQAMETLCDASDVITWEFENVPDKSAHFLASRKKVYPPPAALAVSQDRFSEKTLFTRLGIAIPAFHTVDSREDLVNGLEKTGFPAVLKTRRMGYDGKGQAVIRNEEEIDRALELTGMRSCILEAFVPFTREISVIAARSFSGETVFYPLSENTHRDGILRYARCTFDDPRQKEAESMIRRILGELSYTGVLALELFDTPGGLLANEMAPRVHNSGHWTIEGSITSQFENHLRAVAGLPLGNTAARGPVAMLNCIGAMPDREQVLAIEGAHYHDYGKKPRTGRKVGHITVCAARDAELAERVEAVRRLLPDG